jgi:predicted RNase H-like nuclease (RuvC/YqgF family)
MSAIERLKDKVDSWKDNFHRLQRENEELQKKLDKALSGGDEVKKLRAEIAEKNRIIDEMKKELESKDAEIEAIIVKVEALLD